MLLGELGSTLKPEMVVIPAGVLHQKDDRKKERWTAQIQSFAASRYPVTQGLYAAVLDERPAQFSGDDLPVESVSWFDAIRFCNRLSESYGLKPSYLVHEDGVVERCTVSDGFRLLTDAEWEYACRAGSQGTRYGPLEDIGWFAGNSSGTSQAVGGKKPNEFGLYDMLGNVWEWCWDLYDPVVYGEYRVFKGGGWADDERGCLVTNRRRSHPTFRVEDLGFRIARSMRLTGST
ncbi:Formylglycine-generating enzyme, required for sulfatase activity, contains SUMF1/FGE domain [Pseudovibrio ascidiaceicola]|uniref:Formylglycine-generating enzyme, required for sulfatase activity, contains SUMF1/FGE domain n=1 Tax=Pseudovibrio ascidiaceicola TaxID=285279 RepID=A0A1I3XQH4_9HYPH|nr:SUMF1/EgtB/PvdO family nonheme iron enzyme [Pseudovibrio ascidiaceicola]SFK21782.1 Formylglycine-generating enzyme, required for sulfatase activity, contains SUMF1/FGE domain [Pseudovibrio ascidiaceicola]